MTLASRMILASIPVLISMYAKRWKAEDEAASFVSDPPDFNLPVSTKYDFIVVGAGLAGCVLANRLSNSFSVLLLELGGDPPPLTDVPYFQDDINLTPDINYFYTTKPQANADLDHGGKMPISAGKMMGGSGSHHGTQWERGSSHDWDNWARHTKDKSWNFKNIEKYFRKCENYQGNYPKENSYGNEGPINIIDGGDFRGSELWFAAGKELGYKVVDPNLPQTVGFKKIQYSSFQGHRVSTYKAYIKPIMKIMKRRLYIFKYSHVQEVLFEGHEAVGVRYLRHGVERVAFASKKVILSAGVFLSPIILFKSGIGPKDQVREAKASTHLVSLPVGKNLMDHPELNVEPILVNDPSYSWSADLNLTLDMVDTYLKTASGPLTSLNWKAEAFLLSNRAKNERNNPRTDSKGQNSHWADIQLGYMHSGGKPNSVGILVSNSRPISKGVLKMNGSAISMDDPNLVILDYKHYAIASDFDVTIDGINLALKIVEKTKAFRKIGAKLSSVPYPPCKSLKFRSNDYWKCYIRQTTFTGFHSGGTCRMGYGKEDPAAVVDSKLNVIGVKKLMVVDASVMPYLTNSNIATPVIVIAEKAADDILKEFGK